MEFEGAIHFSQTDDAHLPQPAADFGADEISMRFYPIDEQHCIRLESHARGQNAEAVRRAAQLNSFGRVINPRSYRSFGDTQGGEHFALSRRRSSAVASHGWNDEWNSPAGFEPIDCGANDGRNPVYAPASGSDRHPTIAPVVTG